MIARWRLKRRKKHVPSAMTAGDLRASAGEARARITAGCVNALVNQRDAAHLSWMAKTTKRPADTNQRAKSIVDIATGSAKATKVAVAKKAKKRRAPSKKAARQREHA